MKSPVVLKTDLANRQVTIICADCFIFSIASWVEGLDGGDESKLKSIIDRQVQLCSKANCKCETPRLEVGAFLSDLHDRYWQVLSIKRGEDTSEVTIRYHGTEI